MKQKLIPFLLILVTGIFQACKKDRDEAPEKEKVTTGVYVLYEGSFGNNNGGIAYYNIETNTSDKNYFKTVNGYDLGETPNDLQPYGSKIYCVVSGTQGQQRSFVEVIDPATGKSLKRISFNSDGGGYMPRYITFHKNKAYVSCYDGAISRIDTATLEIDARLAAGGAMEGITVANGKIYAANSDHSLYPDVTRNTVSVVDADSFTKLNEINVAVNPQKLATATNGDIYVTADGIFGESPASYQRINTQNDVVSNTFEGHIGFLSLSENAGYAIVNPFAVPELKTFNATTGALETDFIKDGTEVTLPYGISINSLNGDVLVNDSKSFTALAGEAYCFFPDGKLNFSFETGANPKSAVFVYTYK